MLELISFQEIRRSFLVSVWFMFLTFPIMVIRVNTVQKEIEWRWQNLLIVGVGSFFLSFVWRYFIKKQETGKKEVEAGEIDKITLSRRIFSQPKFYVSALITISVFALVFMSEVVG